MAHKQIKKVLVTGGNGSFASKLIHALSIHPSYACEFVLIDVTFSTECREKKHKQYVEANLFYWNEEWVQHFCGVDIVFHLAIPPTCTASNGTWMGGSQTLDMNGNVFFAAVKHGVHRIVFASSNHIMGGYLSRGLEIGELSTSLAPIGATNYVLNDCSMDATVYGFTKLAAERLGKSLVDSGRLKSFISARIGWCQEGENHPRSLKAHGHPTKLPIVIENEDTLRQNVTKWYQGMWLSNGDYIRLINACINTNHEGFVIVNAMSKNTDAVWDVSEGKIIGFEPQDDVQHGLKQ